MRTNSRWLIVALLFFATTINYIDRQIIGLLKPILEKEFAWSESDFAIIVVAFTAAYAAGLLSFGWFIDKVGTKMGYTISVVLWSLMGMLHAVARSVTGFVVARIGLGLGEAGNFPAGMKAISEWFPTKERGVAAGIFNSGTAVGVVLAVLITPWILVTFGWQEVFLITGASGFIWLVFWLWLYEIPARQKRLSPEELALIRQGQEEGEMKAKIPWIRLFAYPQTWAFLFGKFFIDPIFWFFLFWLPSYFASAFKLDLTRPSPELMIIYGATTLGSIYGGYLSSYMIRRGMAVIKARKTALLIFAVIELSILSAQFVTNIWVAVAIISLVVAVHQAWATNVFTLASDMFPREAVSSVVGIGGTAGAIGGMMFPILVGYLLDTYKAAENLPGGYNVLFTLCGVTYLVTWCIIHFLTRNRDRVEMS
jgi:ACS family hexuronate transporter-like MFS transporter